MPSVWDAVQAERLKACPDELSKELDEYDPSDAFHGGSMVSFIFELRAKALKASRLGWTLIVAFAIWKSSTRIERESPQTQIVKNETGTSRGLSLCGNHVVMLECLPRG